MDQIIFAGRTEFSFLKRERFASPIALSCTSQGRTLQNDMKLVGPERVMEVFKRKLGLIEPISPRGFIILPQSHLGPLLEDLVD